MKNLVREVTHPALIPGIGVEDTSRTFRTNWVVLGVAGIFAIAVLIWGITAPDNILFVGQTALGWVQDNFGWLFALIAVVTLVFMLVVGYGRTGGVRLGADDEQPEFSTGAWIAMLFSAGMGIGLLFWGAAEPLDFFQNVPPGVDAEPGSRDAMMAALAQSTLHWGPMAWGFYALVGGAIAYAAYRRGRAPLISAILYPIFKEKTEGWIGSVIDIFAILVTLFGTAVTLGLGTLQVAAGVEVVSGIGEVGNAGLIIIVTILTAGFVVSAVSGIKRGIRLLSNVNMVLAGTIALVVFIGGPTLFLTNIIPSSVPNFISDLWMMLARNPEQGEDAATFVSSWTNYYWSWWISWTPFVGMFIAKISRGRTLRQFVTVVILVPSAVSVLWFGIMGGAAMFFDEQSGGALTGAYGAGGAQSVLYALFGALQSNVTIFGATFPLASILNVAAMASIVMFFVTSADSAAIVMGSISQRGRPEPTTWVSIMWGVLLGAISVTLLIAGGTSALDGLQAIMVVTALPFVLILIGVLISFGSELRSDPYMIRRAFEKAALAQGVRKGIEEYGDDFVLGATEVAPADGAGSDIDTDSPALTEWWDTATEAIEIIPAADSAETDEGVITDADPTVVATVTPEDEVQSVDEESTSRRERRENRDGE
ncbi:BCCT family transporter [Microbacterium amylolyticum]|uniref:Choline/carnitine/betaine transport n=1 Tax=Microbacterium amylolyticum TaxID=936337 RepID=A0ABS4ZGN5_9MICO|nr:BCCT family transporter [Microbacterium amylolyticum]MBP2436435.1 choline/carnitine/betaine transport [Microbacterium amylolyticum]